MDEELRKAAVNGDVGFLEQCVESNKPIEYYLASFPKEEDKSGKFHYGNIFHLAAMENKEDFIQKAMGILPQDAKQQLLVQLGDELDNWNPLHEAAKVGNIEIVKMFLDVYRCLPTLPSDLTKRPWLMKISLGSNACGVAISNNHEECALEIFRMDTDLISNMPSERGASLVHEAITKKMSKLALEILRSPHPVSCAGTTAGHTPFHEINYIEGSDGSEEILRRLLQRDLGIIKQKTEEKYSAFNVWAADGKMWPFKVLLDNSDDIQGLNEIFRELMSSTDIFGDNPLHDLALNTTYKEEAKKIAELLVDTYKKDTSKSNDQLPWLVKDNAGDTPFSLALAKKNESIARYFLSLDENVVIESETNVLFLAIENGCHTVADEILKIVDNKGWTQLLTNDQHLNVLHLAPLCTEYLCTQLIEGHPELIKGVNKEGSTIIHSWIKSDKEWLFKFILESKWKVPFVKLIVAMDYNKRNNLFHVAATTTHDATIKIVPLLVEAYKEKCLNLNTLKIQQFPWFEKNKQDEGPLHLAIRNQREELALYILSLHDEDDHINELLDYYEPEHSILFLAIQNNCPKVTEKILSRLDEESWTKYLKDPSNGQNILHLATSLTDENFGRLLVNKAPKFITEKDNKGQSAWDKAYEIGPAWFIKAVLDKDPSIFDSEPLVWTKACEKGHVSALCAFIEHDPEAFRDLCIENRDSPLHHIRLKNLTGYEKFLNIKRMKDLINLQDSQGETPLHKAIRNGDLFLTETLLSIDKIIYDIEDDGKISAMDLLAQECNKDDLAWDRMCKRIGLDPRVKTTYFKSKTNLLEVRSSLFVVAALLATITFTAGFTLPGGFNQDNGEALLATKAAFLVFLISDTLALFFSMLVLICLVWSMVFDPSKSLFLIDRSMVFLRSALNLTLLAFMTGVYIVIAPKALWAAILIIVIISSLIGISINKTFLYNVLEYLDKSIPSRTKKPKDRIRMVEKGITDDNAGLIDQPSRGELVRRPSTYKP